MNTGKTKLMKVGTFEETGTIQVGGGSIEEVEEFCYLGNVISREGSCDKDIRTRLGKANTTFGILSNLWKNKKLNLQVKGRLYESLVLSILQYGSETWSMTVANRKKLEAAHHRWMRRILGITWKQMVNNEEVRKITGMGMLEEILRRNRLRWMGHIHRMDGNQLAKQALNWTQKDGGRKRGRPRKNWRATVTGFKDDRYDMEGRGGDCWRPDCVEQLCCPMCCRHADGLRSKVRMTTKMIH